MELLNDIDQQEKHRPQAHDGKYVGEENDIRVFGYRENSRDRIDSKYQICHFDNHQHQKQGCDQLFAIDLDEEFTTLKFWVNREIFRSKLYHAVIFRVYLIFLVTVDEHHYPGIHQESAK